MLTRPRDVLAGLIRVVDRVGAVVITGRGGQDTRGSNMETAPGQGWAGTAVVSLSTTPPWTCSRGPGRTKMQRSASCLPQATVVHNCLDLRRPRHRTMAESPRLREKLPGPARLWMLRNTGHGARTPASKCEAPGP